VPDPTNPQSFNRYSYCYNNPLKFNDPTGHEGEESVSMSFDQYMQWIAYGGNVPLPSLSNQELSSTPTLPIENNNKMFVVWGYTSRGGIIYQKFTSTIVVVDENGQYSRIITNGHGAGIDFGVSCDVIQPGQENKMFTQDTWAVQMDVTLIGVFNLDASAMVRRDSDGYKVDGSAYSYLALGFLGVSLTVQNTFIQQISPSEMFVDMPYWVKDAYKSKFDIVYHNN